MAEKNSQANPFLTPTAIVLAGIIVGAAVVVNGQLLERRGRGAVGGEAPSAVAEAPKTEAGGQVAGAEGVSPKSTIGSFLVLEEEVCREDDGRPIVYYFGQSRCPHCSWEHPIIKRAMEKFSGTLSFHDLMDDQGGADMDVFQKYAQYNGGAIPFLVFGCRYIRVGSGESIGEEQEEKVLTALSCKLAGGSPGEVCSSVSDLIGQLE